MKKKIIFIRTIISFFPFCSKNEKIEKWQIFVQVSIILFPHEKLKNEKYTTFDKYFIVYYFCDFKYTQKMKSI